MVVLSIYLYWGHRRDLKVFLGSKSVMEVYNISKDIFLSLKILINGLSCRSESSNISLVVGQQIKS